MGGNKKINIAEAYYQAMGEKDIAAVGQYVHSEVEFIAPLAKAKGKEAILEAARRFTTLFHTLTIYAKLEGEGKVVIIYDLDCPSPIGSIRTASLLSFKEDLISRIELFYDPRPFVK